ncbi:hypothetical protein J2785_007265 [Burkholderia ambifaria]|nr:hypothetical protein [Burkholderia ambifaria]
MGAARVIFRKTAAPAAEPAPALEPVHRVAADVDDDPNFLLGVVTARVLDHLLKSHRTGLLQPGDYQRAEMAYQHGRLLPGDILRRVVAGQEQ